MKLPLARQRHPQRRSLPWSAVNDNVSSVMPDHLPGSEQVPVGRRHSASPDAKSRTEHQRELTGRQFFTVVMNRHLHLRVQAAGRHLHAAAVVAVILLSPSEEPGRRHLAPEEVGKRHLTASAAEEPGMPAYISALTRALEYECMGAGKQLLASLGTSGNRLGLEAAAAIEQSVHPIDIAIKETKSALERNPGDPELLQMLTSRYERKLSLLHQAIRLAGEA